MLTTALAGPRIIATPQVRSQESGSIVELEDGEGGGVGRVESETLVPEVCGDEVISGSR